MSFISILFSSSTYRTMAENANIPLFFSDLYLDQIIDAITEKWNEYDLKPFFYLSIKDVDGIKYRQEIFRDLENESLYKHVKSFTEQMREVRRLQKLAEKLYYKYQKEIWFLYAAEIYCDAVRRFSIDLMSLETVNSRGFYAFRKVISDYAESVNFQSLLDEVKSIRGELEKIKYQIIIGDGNFTVQNLEEATDYSSEIEETFEKFKQGAVKNYKVNYASSPADMNHIEAQILNFVAKLNPESFLKLESFVAANGSFIDETIAIFDREIHFYIAYLDHIQKFRNNGLHFCYPNITIDSKEINNYEGFDLALAQKLELAHTPIVCNDFYLKGEERIIVVTGPNQGGKTTFARTFGQLHYLANIGCPVPGRQAQLFLFDEIFTQFERSEKVENLRGKLEDDLKRIQFILNNATSRSIIILNEIFNSTTLQDMTFLSKKILSKIIDLDLICVLVTFVDEMASFSSQIVSMTSMIVTENPALRTYKIVRRPADGLAYAMAIAEKYRLTYSRIKERIES